MGMEIRTQVFLGSWLDDHYEVGLNSGILYVCRKIIVYIMSLSCEDFLHSIFFSEQLRSEVILTDTS